MDHKQMQYQLNIKNPINQITIVDIVLAIKIIIICLYFSSISESFKILLSSKSKYENNPKQNDVIYDNKIIIKPFCLSYILKKNF